MTIGKWFFAFVLLCSANLWGSSEAVVLKWNADMYSGQADKKPGGYKQETQKQISGTEYSAVYVDDFIVEIVDSKNQMIRNALGPNLAEPKNRIDLSKSTAKLPGFLRPVLKKIDSEDSPMIRKIYELPTKSAPVVPPSAPSKPKAAVLSSDSSLSSSSFVDAPPEVSDGAREAARTKILAKFHQNIDNVENACFSSNVCLQHPAFYNEIKKEYKATEFDLLLLDSPLFKATQWLFKVYGAAKDAMLRQTGGKENEAVFKEKLKEIYQNIPVIQQHMDGKPALPSENMNELLSTLNPPTTDPKILKIAANKMPVTCYALMLDFLDKPVKKMIERAFTLRLGYAPAVFDFDALPPNFKDDRWLEGTEEKKLEMVRLFGLDKGEEHFNLIRILTSKLVQNSMFANEEMNQNIYSTGLLSSLEQPFNLDANKFQETFIKAEAAPVVHKKVEKISPEQMDLLAQKGESLYSRLLGLLQQNQATQFATVWPKIIGLSSQDANEQLQREIQNTAFQVSGKTSEYNFFAKANLWVLMVAFHQLRQFDTPANKALADKIAEFIFLSPEGVKSLNIKDQGQVLSYTFNNLATRLKEIVESGSSDQFVITLPVGKPKAEIAFIRGHLETLKNALKKNINSLKFYQKLFFYETLREIALDQERISYLRREPMAFKGIPNALFAEQDKMKFDALDQSTLGLSGRYLETELIPLLLEGLQDPDSVLKDLLINAIKTRTNRLFTLSKEFPLERWFIDVWMKNNAPKTPSRAMSPSVSAKVNPVVVVEDQENSNPNSSPVATPSPRKSISSSANLVRVLNQLHGRSQQTATGGNGGN